MTATVTLQGRFGNQLYSTATLIAYAKKHGMDYHIPTHASHCDGTRVYLKVPSTTGPLDQTIPYFEPTPNNQPFYHDIPKIDRINLIGYWQSFKYFDWCRQDVLEAFGVPYEPKPGVVGIHVRLGDYLIHSDAFPPLPLSYYQKAVQYFRVMGYSRFIMFSDDIPKCMENFTHENFNTGFEFSTGTSEIEDMSLLSSCEHQVVANSSFSFMAAWLNRNPDKIVVCPSYENLFRGANKHMIPEEWIQIKP
jgi:hypothetical protein